MSRPEAHSIEERPEIPPSWLSKNNCAGYVEGLRQEISDFDEQLTQDLRELLRRPVSMSQGAKLREEAIRYKDTDSGEWIPLSWSEDSTPQSAEYQARFVAELLREFRGWMDSYEDTKLVFENGNGESCVADLENSYMESYSKNYYAKLKQFERAIQRHFSSPKTAMLTLTASSENKAGLPRSPADHMRDIADGWKKARRELYRSLRGCEWEYVKIWEPHQSGYGHLHIGIIVESTADIGKGDFVPFLESYTNHVKSAGTGAHTVDKSVSITENVHDLGCYLSEYLGIYGEGESVTDRSLHEQIFYSVSWATNTRRIEFSNGAQELINEQHQLENQQEQERGTVPTVSQSDCEAEKRRSQEPAESATDMAMETIEGGSDNAQDDWELIAVEDENEDRHPPPQGSSVSMAKIDGKPGWDRPKIVD